MEQLVCSCCGKRLLKHDMMVRRINALSRANVVGLALELKDGPIEVTLANGSYVTANYISSCCDKFVVKENFFIDFCVQYSMILFT